MRSLRVTLASLVASACAAAAAVESGLPAWNEVDRAARQADEAETESILPTHKPIRGENQEAEQESLEIIPPAAGEITDQDGAQVEVPEKFWPAYFAERPKSFLIDPQGLLSSVDYRDRLGFLDYHAGDSSIDLFVYVFKGGQDIPGEVRDEELVERFFSKGRPAVVVYYYMGEPQRSVLYLSPTMTDAVPAAEQRRALESSAMQAFKNSDPSGQFEAFLVQMSIRIYWMERMMGGGEPVAEETHPVAKVVKSKDRKAELLAKLQPVLDRVSRLAIPFAVVAGAILAALAMGAWMRSRARYRFPDFEVEPRLGGDHAAGVGAVISFASAAVPPASQRDQVPDYLRRA